MKEELLYAVLTGVLTLVVVGCSGKSTTAKKVILQDPQTMEFVKCNAGQWGSDSPFETNEECIEDYKSKGYIVWGEQD
jgi:hypothetical protein